MLSMNKKVLLGLSGGVDSSVAMHLLQEKGYYVEAACIDFSPCHSTAVSAAKKSAELLGIKLHIIECHKEFDKKVITPFCDWYLNGKTPNPCIFCNREVKFQKLLEKADELGFDNIATGHYAQIVKSKENYFIKKASFLPKDQSYMLYRLSQNQLSRLVLPLECYSKEQIREIASNLGLHCANAPDSQEICFIQGETYSDYIENRFGKSKIGSFISPDGEIVSQHKGIIHYTVGQRKGLGLSLGYPVFIKSIDAETGNIYLGKKGEPCKQDILITDCIFPINYKIGDKLECSAKVRYSVGEKSCIATIIDNNKMTLHFTEPQTNACCSGQSCVIYNNNCVIGGGYIV